MIDVLNPEIEASAFRYLAVMNGIFFRKLDKDYQNRVYSLATKNYYRVAKQRLAKCTRYTWALFLLLAMDVFAREEKNECLSLQLRYTAIGAIKFNSDHVAKHLKIKKPIIDWAIKSFNGIYVACGKDNYLFETDNLALVD
jgi:hypothetical protein